MLELHHFIRMGSTGVICARCEVSFVLADARSALALDREGTQEPRAEAEPEARVRSTGCGAALLGGPEKGSGSQAGGNRRAGQEQAAAERPGRVSRELEVGGLPYWSQQVRLQQTGVEA
jgi:hypothetical protein